MARLTRTAMGSRSRLLRGTFTFRPASIGRANRMKSEIKAVLCLLIVASAHLSMAKIVSRSGKPEFDVSFPQSVHQEAVTGRLLLFVSRFKDPEVRLQDDPEMLGVNVEQMRANEAAAIDSSAAAYPLESLNDLPSGDYYVQAVLNIYTEFHRA